MPKTLLALILVVGSVTFGVSEGRAAPVEYVRVCSLYGVGYYYIPGTDVCYNVFNGETRQQTEGGTWRSSIPNAPVQYASNAGATCLGGTLVPLGTLDNEAFTRNTYQYMEASLAALPLGDGDFVSSFAISGDLTRYGAALGTVRFSGVDATTIPRDTVIVRADGTRYYTTSAADIGGGGTGGVVDVTAIAFVGGATGVMTAGTTLALENAIVGVDAQVTVIDGFQITSVGAAATSDLCLSFRDAAGTYVPLGCEEVTQLKHSRATLSFAPRHARPPVDLVAPVAVSASIRDWRIGSVEGQVTVSACIRNANADGNVCSVLPTASGATINCGTSTATLTNGAQGPAGGSCTVSDKGDGTATMTCPDGSAIAVVTQVPNPVVNDDGCVGAPGANALLVGIALVGRMMRKRKRL